jgi:outer membrane protein
MRTRQTLAICVAWSCLVCPSLAQQQALEVEKPQAPIILRPYKGATVPQPRLKNSNRLHDLIRAGKLYLTVQDAIALAIENNLDLEMDRYGPLASQWQLERVQAGGPLRGVTAGNSLANQVTSGQGVAGSVQAAGLSSGTGGGGGGGGGGAAVVSQIGPITPNLDPVFLNGTLFSHSTSLQANTTVSQTPALVSTTRLYDNSVTEGLLTGGVAQVSANESYVKQNALTDILNPSVEPSVQIYVRHNFLQGFGTGVNGRGIRVAEKNIGAAQETFRSQLLNLVASVLNLYWGLVGDNENLKASQRSLEIAQKFYNDTKRQIELSALAKVDIYRARGELTTRQQELAIAQTTVRQQENLLKSALSRTGLEDPLVDVAEVVPLDSIQVPAEDDLPPLRDLVKRALAKRPDIAFSKISDENAEISALGTANGVLPTLRGVVSTYDTGLAGKSNPQPGTGPADPYYVGGFATALGQIFRRNFPSEQASITFFGNFHNRVAQGDYGVEQLQLRQSDLVTRRAMNQLVVDISNQMIALRQARARYSTAVDTRTLQEQLLEKEQRKFSLGNSTINDLVVAQRSLAAARIAEVAALTIFSRARVSLDQVIGETLEKNNVSVGEALKGRVARDSRVPSPIEVLKD